jgi:hypothetical protein
MPVTSKVSLDLRPLKQLRRSVSADLRGGGNGPIGRALTKKWPERFFAFQRREFVRNSAGGGKWAPLSPATLGRRRAEGFHGKLILRVTRTIFNALFPGRPGNVVRRKGAGVVEMGIGGDDRHPEARMTIARLAQLHHEGGTNLPARVVINPIDAATTLAMNGDTAAGFRSVVRSLPKPARK